MRAKGVVCLEHRVWVEIHVVGKRWHAMACRNGSLEETAFVLIGLFEVNEMQRALQALERFQQTIYCIYRLNPLVQR